MKTYEEMARDVLRRRDEELAELQLQQASPLKSQINPPPEVVYPGVRKKLGLLPKIAIPCAAAVLVGAVGVTVWKNTQPARGMYIQPGIADEREPDTTPAEDGEVAFAVAPSIVYNIYEGGETVININEADEWLVYNLPALLEEDYRSIDYNINDYYGMEFDRLSRAFPEWKSEHEPFGTYEHDEDDGFVVSHRIIYTTNSIEYTTEDGGTVSVAANRTGKYASADVENALPSVINGFDAMVYYCPLYEEYAANITMDNTNVTIWTNGVDEEEFLNILDVYTAPYIDGDNDNNQTMEDKIVVYNGKPDFIIMNQIPYEPEIEDKTDCIWIQYTTEELNALYGINFTCLSELHPDWKKTFDEKSFGIYVRDYPSVVGEDMAASGGREIVSTRNWLYYYPPEIDSLCHRIDIFVLKSAIPETDIEHSLINGYDAVIFLGAEYEDDEYRRYGAFIDMDGTLVCITESGVISEEDFIELLREYTSEASKYTYNPTTDPVGLDAFSAVDPFDGRITYNVNWNVESGWWSRTAKAKPYGLYDTDNLETTLGNLKDFFGTDMLPVDGQYKDGFERYLCDGRICCRTAEGAIAYSPVDGKVMGASVGYNRGLGNCVAVEFGDKIFIIGHLDEIYVEVGDTVTAGDVLGVCGRSGNVYFDDPPLLTLIAMQRVD